MSEPYELTDFPEEPMPEALKRFCTLTVNGYKVKHQLHVWCKYCCSYHYHGLGEGHRVPHCWSPESYYLRTGGYRIRVVEGPRPPRKSQPCEACGGNR